VSSCDSFTYEALDSPSDLLNRRRIGQHEGVEESDQCALSVPERRYPIQDPVDWSDPDTWIAQRLSGPDRDMALQIWQQSGKSVNPRYLSRRLAAMDRFGLASVANGKYVITERGRSVLGGDLSVITSSLESDDRRPRDDVFVEFWRLFLEEARSTDSRFAGAQAQRSSWLRASAGMRGLGYVVAVRRFHTSVELYIDIGSRETNCQFLEELREHQADIEAAFGAALQWIVRPEQRAVRVVSYLDGGYADSETLSDPAEELFEGSIRFEAALQPFVDPMLPERRDRSGGWQPRDQPWTEDEFLAGVRDLAIQNAVPATAILRWAHSDSRVSIEGGWGPQNAGLRLRTARPDDPTSEHSFINLYANSADNASAEVQFASMAKREPFVDRRRRVELLNQLNSLSTSTSDEEVVNMRLQFRIRDLRDPLGSLSGYLSTLP
jgi:hypothetical protein